MYDHAESTFESYDGLSLYYQRWRPAGKDTPRAAVAVIHGGGEHSGRYGNVVDCLVPDGMAVYAFDLRGHGRSPGPRGHWNRFDDVRNDVRRFLGLVRQQEPMGPLFLLGHSLGGLIVLDSVLHDASGLTGVVASGAFIGRMPFSPAKILLAKTMSSLVPRLTLATGLEKEALSRDPAVVEAYANDPLVHGLASTRFGTEIMTAIDWTQAHAADLALPLLMVHGGADRIAFPEGSQRFFEHVTFADKERRVYDGYYHEVFNDAGKEQVLADVARWLAARIH